MTIEMIRVQTTSGKVIISVNGSGRIDATNGTEFYQTISQYIENGQTIILDLKKVIFIDTDGFNIMIRIKNEADQAGCVIMLSQISDALAELFNLMCLGNFFEFTGTDLSNTPLVLN